jgi:hypothetical protein
MGLDAQPYTVFRHLILARRTGATADMPILVVRFRFARGTQAVNRRASLLPIPLIVGYPGFREKIWTMNPRTGYWQGIYQWESDSDAANYCRSFVLSIMTRRTEQGSLSCTVVDHSPVAAEDVIRASQTACSYSCSTPPRRSRRWMARWAIRSGSVIGSGSGASGRAFAMP